MHRSFRRRPHTFKAQGLGRLTAHMAQYLDFHDDPPGCKCSGKATLATGEVINYLYNGLEQRTLKTGPTTKVDSGARYYAYDEEGHLIGEYDAAGNPAYEVVYLGDTPVAVITQTRTGSPVQVSTQLHDIYADHIDTPRVIVQSGNHAIRWRWDQAEAFGNSAANENPSSLGVFTFNLRFPGQTFDKETGWFYNHHRDYRAGAGRYAQSDPIGLAGGINTYAYVGGNPLSRTDASGLACTSAFGQTFCEFPDGPSFIVPQPPGFPNELSPGDWFYHRYDVQRKLGGADPRCVMAELRKNATPGESRGASRNGVVNMAKVGPLNNPVISYVTNDVRNGDRLIVNITFAGGAFADGYVARGIIGDTVHTWGEGNSAKQSPNSFGIFTAIGQYAANELLWGSQMEEIIRRCSCKN